MTNHIKTMIAHYKNQGDRVDEVLYQEVITVIERMEKLLEGNDGMSVAEIKSQFVDLHRDSLKSKRLASEAHEHMTHAKQEFHKLQELFMNLEDEITRKNEALEFYANQQNYTQGMFKAAVMLDGGKTAILALK